MRRLTPCPPRPNDPLTGRPVAARVPGSTAGGVRASPKNLDSLPWSDHGGGACRLRSRNPPFSRKRLQLGDSVADRSTSCFGPPRKPNAARRETTHMRRLRCLCIPCGNTGLSRQGEWTVRSLVTISPAPAAAASCGGRRSSDALPRKLWTSAALRRRCFACQRPAAGGRTAQPSV